MKAISAVIVQYRDTENRWFGNVYAGAEFGAGKAAPIVIVDHQPSAIACLQSVELYARQAGKHLVTAKILYR